MQITFGVATALLLVSQSSADRLPSSDNVLALRDCIVSAKDDRQLPAQQPGVIKVLENEDGMPIEAGDVVEAGELIGNLDNEDATARKEAAILDHQVAGAERLKAESSVEAADATLGVARAELDESLYVNKRAPNSIPPTEVRRQELTVTRAMMEKGVSRRDVEVAVLTEDLRQAQVTVADIDLRKHQIVSPLSGVIHQIFRQPGEWVSPGDPIARIVRMDTVRVEGFVNAEKYLPEDVDGQPVTITVRRPGRKSEQFKAEISFVSSIVEASGEFRVWADVENRPARGKHWILRPGMDAEMHIELPAAR